ncbi:AMP-dependent synthetase/ligase [Christensenella timonensis]|uniref:AMP-dependent synthetase/ligase n=1 Tax=Christensenella timonensis TaxID=1816678 RepID=UPI0008366D81|nr:AMP-binding protein [Christensenella timonensis]
MKNYPDYEVPVLNSLKELVDYAAHEYHDAAAFMFRDGTGVASKSYREFREDIQALGTALLLRGFHGAHIAVLGENSYAWLVTYFAVVNGGNVIVPVDKDLSEAEMAEVLKRSHCSVLIHSRKYRETALGIGAGLKLCVDMDSADGNGFDALLCEGRQAVGNGERGFSDYEVDIHRLAAIVYTSGTTGKSKGVMLSHANLMADAVAARRKINLTGPSLLMLPLHHTFGFTANVLCGIFAGYTIFINDNLKYVIKDMQEFKPVNLFVVPMILESMYHKVWSTAKKSGKDKKLLTGLRVSNALMKLRIDLRRKLFAEVLAALGGKLEFCICGGAFLDEKIAEGFRELGVHIMNGYGVTECAPIVAENRNGYYNDKSVGVLLPCNEVRIDRPDETGEGEILVRGANVMLGYFEDDIETKKVFDNGWYKTGDLGRLDADGFLYVTGRIKNLIILSNGKNISPEEIEGVFRAIPYVEEIVAYGENDRILAEVFLNRDYFVQNGITDIRGTLDRDVDELNKTLPPYKQLSGVKIRETDFERTTTQKIKREHIGA